jgi:hypothetical protein
VLSVSSVVNFLKFGLQVPDEVGFFEAHFREGGVFVLGGAVAGGAGDDGVVALRREVEDRVVFPGINAFERAIPTSAAEVMKFPRAM